MSMICLLVFLACAAVSFAECPPMANCTCEEDKFGSLSIACTDLNWTVIPADLSLPKRTASLTITKTNISTVPTGLFSGQTQLSKVDLSGNWLTGLAENTFDGVTGLKVLNVANNQLTRLPGKLLLNQKDVKDVYMAGNKWQCCVDGIYEFWLMAKELPEMRVNGFVCRWPVSMVNKTWKELDSESDSESSSFPACESRSKSRIGDGDRQQDSFLLLFVILGFCFLVACGTISAFIYINLKKPVQAADARIFMPSGH